MAISIIWYSHIIYFHPVTKKKYCQPLQKNSLNYCQVIFLK